MGQISSISEGGLRYKRKTAICKATTRQSLLTNQGDFLISIVTSYIPSTHHNEQGAMWINMNETILIITVASIVGVLLGRLIPWLATRMGKVRPSETQANNQIEVRTISKEPSLPPQPA